MQSFQPRTACRQRVHPFAAIIAAALFVFALSVPAAAGPALQDVFPVPGFAQGWTLDGKVTRFNKDNLFDHINGEAELYFPYGFVSLASAVYVSKKNSELSIVADVYQMGSGLDAFGIYSNYRKASNTWVAVGAEGFVSATQLLFYQDRYFVRLQVTGETALPEETLPALARAISAKLPPGSGKPGELQAVNIEALIPHSERYVAQSLLGYAFFRRGLIADAARQNEKMQIFAIREKTEAQARKTFNQYLAYVKAAAPRKHSAGKTAWRRVEATDPLYGNVRIEQFGRYIIGVIRIKNDLAATTILEQLHQQISADAGGR